MLDGRQTVVEYHILHMQHTVFPRRTARFVLSRLDIPVFRCQLHYRIEYHDRNVTGYQLQQQVVGLLLRLASYQAQHPYALTGVSGFHNERQCLRSTFRQIPLFFKTALHQVFPHGLILHRSFQRIGRVLQPMGSLVIHRNTQPLYTQQLVNRVECIIRYVLRNTFQRIFFPLQHLLVFGCRHYRGGKHLLVDFQYLFQVPTVYQSPAEIQNIIPQT